MLPSVRFISPVPSRRGGLVAILVASAALLASVLLPGDAAAATKRDSGTLVWTDMRPLPGRSERGIAHLTIKPRGRDSINALAIGLTLDPNDPSGKTAYGLRLSRRSCSAIRRNPADPGYVSGLLASAEYFASSGAASWQGPVTLDSKTTRAARSMVLIGMGDGSVRQLVACGKGYKVEFSDVIISS